MTPTNVLSRLGRVSCVINPLSGSTPEGAADLLREKLSGLPDAASIHTVGDDDLALLMEAALAISGLVVGENGIFPDAHKQLISMGVLYLLVGDLFLKVSHKAGQPRCLHATHATPLFLDSSCSSRGGGEISLGRVFFFLWCFF